MKKRKISALFIILVAVVSILLTRQTYSAEESSDVVQADKILVEKSKRKLSLLRNGTVLKTYTISLGKNPVGPKIRQGDNKTPEGTYMIDSRNPDSDYYLSLHISYPNESDIRNADSLGVPPGGNIMIHGIPREFDWTGEMHLPLDWTKGCIAVTNSDIEEIWYAVPDRTPIEIVP